MQLQIFELHEVSPRRRDFCHVTARQLCTAVQLEDLPPLSRVARCNRDRHVLLTSLHFKSSPVFVTFLFCKNCFPSMLDSCATDVQLTADSRVEREWREARKSQFAIRPLLVPSPVHPDLALCRNLFRHVLHYAMRHMLKLSNLRNFSFCCNLRHYHRNSCFCWN